MAWKAARLPPYPLYEGPGGVASVYPLSTLSYHALSLIIIYGMITNFLFKIASKTHVLSCIITYHLSRQHSIYHLSIIIEKRGKRKKERKKTVQEKGNTDQEKFTSREEVCGGIKIARHKLGLLVTVELLPSTDQRFGSFVNRLMDAHLAR